MELQGVDNFKKKQGLFINYLLKIDQFINKSYLFEEILFGSSEVSILTLLKKYVFLMKI